MMPLGLSFMISWHASTVVLKTIRRVLRGGCCAGLALSSFDIASYSTLSASYAFAMRLSISIRGAMPTFIAGVFLVDGSPTKSPHRRADSVHSVLCSLGCSLIASLMTAAHPTRHDIATA